MKSFLKWGMSAVLATLAAPALAHGDVTGTQAEWVQLAGLESARAACYIDTTAWDVATPDYCSAIVWWQSKATAVFSVVGIDQSSGRYQLTYLDNKCSRVWYTTQEGWSCSRSIGPFRDHLQRVQVTDLQTGQSVILSAIANYVARPPSKDDANGRRPLSAHASWEERAGRVGLRVLVTRGASRANA